MSPLTRGMVMERIASTSTHDLGNGWWVNFNEDGGLTVRSPDRGQRINLAKESVQTLRDILRTSRRRDGANELMD